ncbi:hypothetical protein [Algoriphagus persicinus]|uniref:hypothetical protein n=1 Tax=Algoriphagus persicinus TaxID=3108754 RepID=UPI002B3C76D8|nr:hypothetical protein [Algoriphagus sp. E1-3-M2]MEB2783714.1 hypothetical protein [Algoriphagus sp. E1-3-M2]
MTSLMMSHSIFSPTAIITTEEEWRWATSIMMAYWIFKYAIPVILSGDGSFGFWPNFQHGFQLAGDVRVFAKLENRKLLVVKNNASSEIWKH